MIDLNLLSLYNFLNENDYQAEIQKETGQIFIILKQDQREYPLFFRIFEDSYQLQIMLFIPSHLQKKEAEVSGKKEESETAKKREKTLSEVARMLHLLNKEIDLPGFGMDEEMGLIFYRLVIPTLTKQIDPTLLLNYLKGTEQVCKLFGIPIEAVSTGQTTMQEIMSKAKEMSGKNP